IATLSHMAISVVTFTSGKTNVGQGCIPLVLRAVFTLLIFCQGIFLDLCALPFSFLPQSRSLPRPLGRALPPTFSHQLSPPRFRRKPTRFAELTTFTISFMSFSSQTRDRFQLP